VVLLQFLGGTSCSCGAHIVFSLRSLIMARHRLSRRLNMKFVQQGAEQRLMNGCWRPHFAVGAAVSTLNVACAVLGLAPFTPALLLVPPLTAITCVNAYSGSHCWSLINGGILVFAALNTSLPIGFLWRRPLLGAWFVAPLVALAMATAMGARKRHSVARLRCDDYV
jgi:hypothetical protein